MITLEIPTSKSITNRALIINALTGNQCDLYPVSTSRDSQTMQRLLNQFDSLNELDVLDAGTVMRFLTAFAGVSGQNKILKGSDRMHQRPIKILVEALRKIGVKIDYLEKEGYPPLKIKGYTSLNAHLKLAMDGSVSSQYISALLMIAPTLPKGIELHLTGKIGSRPYIQMTLDIMQHFGVASHWDKNTIKVPGTPYCPAKLVIEPDWSSASYWYSYVSVSNLKKPVSLFLSGYTKNSLQGDAVLIDIYKKLGVQTEFNEEGMFLKPTSTVNSALSIDFSDCPDIAQTVLVSCALHRTKLTLTGLESLRIKETDRIQAMQNELAKLNVHLESSDDITFTLKPERLQIPEEIHIQTYEDHRMAMCFGALSLFCKLSVDDTTVVNKSYPSFWSDLQEVQNL